MNEHDRSNLNYILSMSYYEFEKWAKTLSQDDMEYAIELIKRGRSEIMVQTLELYDEVKSVDQATDIISKVK